MTEKLLPVERCVLRMRDEGLSVEEIGRRLRRSPEHVERIIARTDIPRSREPATRRPRPIERRIVAMRAAGHSHDEIARRFRRSADSIRQIEGLAYFTQALHLLRPGQRGPERGSLWGPPRGR